MHDRRLTPMPEISGSEANSAGGVWGHSSEIIVVN